MRSSSDSAGARGIGFAILGAGFGIGSSSSVLVLRAALPSNWNKPGGQEGEEKADSQDGPRALAIASLNR